MMKFINVSVISVILFVCMVSCSSKTHNEEKTIKDLFGAINDFERGYIQFDSLMSFVAQNQRIVYSWASADNLSYRQFVRSLCYLNGGIEDIAEYDILKLKVSRYMIYFKESGDYDVDNFYLLLETAAINGDANAQYLMYKFNANSAIDLASASEQKLKWLTESAEQGNSMAQYELALLYNEGGDNANAARYFKESADKGNIYAMNNYATMAFKGIGIEKNYSVSFYYTKSVVELIESNSVVLPNNDKAQVIVNLANHYMNGYGVQQNRDKGLELYQKAKRYLD